MIQFTCSTCETELEVADHKAGAKVTCPECGTKLTVPDSAPKAAAPVAKRPSRPGSSSGSGSRSATGMKRPPRRDEEPAAKKSYSGVLVAGILGGLAFVGLIIVVVILLLKEQNTGPITPIASQDPRPPYTPPPRPQATAPPAAAPPATPPQAPPPTSGAVNDAGSPPPRQEEAPPAAPGIENNPAPLFSLPTGGAKGQDVYDYALKSTVLIVSLRAGGGNAPLSPGGNRDGDEGGPIGPMQGPLGPGGPGQPGGALNISIGSGSLIDKSQRIVLTNYHVVHEENEVHVFFPQYKNGQLVTSKQAYLDAVVPGGRGDRRMALKGKVIDRARKKDLALIQLDRVPDNAEALRLAASPPRTGSPVWSIGTPSDSAGAWLLTAGTVRGVAPKQWKATGRGGVGPVFEFDAEIIETDSPINPGDSGGPLVNDQGELVGVTQGYASNARGISFFISTNEVNTFVKQHYQTARLPWPVDNPRALLAVRGIEEVATRTVPTLQRQLRSPNPEQRTQAAVALGQIAEAGSSAAKDAVPDLLRVVREDADDLARRKALEALGKIGAPRREDVQVLIDGLKQTGAVEARRYCARALGLLGHEGRPGLHALLDAARDRAVPLRQEVAAALGKLGPDTKEQVFPVLHELLKDADGDVRRAATEGLTALVGALSASDLPTLVEMLKQDNPEARTFAAFALGKLGAAAKPAVTDLHATFRTGDLGTRRAVIEALGQIGMEPKEAVTLFTEALRDKDLGLRKKACEALARLGPAAEPAGTELREAARQYDKELRRQAVLAFGKIGLKSKLTLPELTVALDDPEKEVQAAACSALADIAKGVAKPDQKKVLPRLGDLLVSPDDTVRSEAARALAQFGSSAVPLLIRALNHQEDNVRLAAATALAELGKEAKAALNHLQAHALQDTNEQVKLKCAEAIKKIMAGK